MDGGTLGRTRVLVVDDSPTMRRLIAAALTADHGIEVVGFAGDPYEARDAIKALSPDVITLDVEMPRMDGLSFLRKLMKLRPTPVVMVSTLTARGTEIALEALMEGAVECFGKPTGADGPAAFAALPGLVRAAAQAVLRPASAGRAAVPPASGFRPGGGRIALIGASTGGVDALCEVLSGFPANCPPTLIVQHMPAGFTAGFAARLDRVSPARVVLAEDGAPLEPGTVRLAPGGARHLVIDARGPLVCRLVEGAPANGHRPSVDRLFESAAPLAGRVAAALLTGMGRDGAAGMKALRDAGARTFAQDRATSVVWGMPRAAMEAGAAERELPIGRIAAALLAVSAAPGAGG